MIELKPCPFCGDAHASQGAMVTSGGGAYKHWVCAGCGAMGPAVADTIQYADGRVREQSAQESDLAAFAAWNIRAVPWVPVSERLPNAGDIVLACRKLGRSEMYVLPYTVQFVFQKFRDHGYFLKEGEVTHWMPLPEPPGEESDA